MSRFKLLLVGRTGAGKDTLRRALERRGLTFVKSATTRPPRTPDEDTHVFVNDAQMDALWPDAVATTEIDGARYCTTNTVLDASDGYIIDPDGARELFERRPDLTYLVVRLDAERPMRRAACIARVSADTDPRDAAKAFDARDSDEDARFSEFDAFADADSFQEMPQCAVAMMSIDNDYLPETLEAAADAIMAEVRCQRNLERLVSLAMARGIAGDAHADVPLKLASSDDPCRVAGMIAHHDSEVMELIRVLLNTIDVDFSAHVDYNAVYTARYDHGVDIESDVRIDPDSMHIDAWGETRVSSDSDLGELSDEFVEYNGTLHTVFDPNVNDDPIDVLGHGLVSR